MTEKARRVTMSATTRSRPLSGRMKNVVSVSSSTSSSSSSSTSDEQSPPRERPRPGGRGYIDPAIQRVLCFCRMCQGVLKKMPRTMRGHMRKWGPFEPKGEGQSSKSHPKNKKRKTVDEASLEKSPRKSEKKQKVEKQGIGPDRTSVGDLGASVSYCECFVCQGELLMSAETSRAHILKWGPSRKKSSGLDFSDILINVESDIRRGSLIRRFIGEQKALAKEIIDLPSCEQAYTTILARFFSELELPSFAAWSKAFEGFCSRMWDEVYRPQMKAPSRAPHVGPLSLAAAIEMINAHEGSRGSSQATPHQNSENYKKILDAVTDPNDVSRDAFEVIWADEWNRKWVNTFEPYKKCMESTQQVIEKIISAATLGCGIDRTTSIQQTQLPSRATALPVQSSPGKQGDNVKSDDSHSVLPAGLCSEPEKLLDELNMVRANLQSAESYSASLQVRLEALEERHEKTVQDLELEKEKVLSLQDMHGITARELEEEKEKSLCQICMERPRDTCILPCLHLSYCSQCVVKHHQSNKTCPACRTPSSGFLVTSLYSVR
ncbi:hypothetical protein R1sor_017745 [Riccia sorocarpa]|uniref:RING-type domain-containing protein n=1 Tax=Riccia sorocarpa TaxID=122646 RepID=A0ABD3I7T2_9MARC